jgi:transcriptional antiterminator RfaH
LNWYALYTKPRREDAVALLLQGSGIEVLNPKLKSKRYKHNRFIETVEPLFPCYLLARFERERCFHFITYTRGVRYIVGKSNPVIVREEIVGAIKQRMKDGNKDGNIVINDQKFEKGDRVFIKEGPFKDFNGIFEKETRGHERVIILLNTINFRVELDRWLLKKQ